MLELISYMLICLGAFFTMVAAIGVYRLQGLYMKLHAATKAGTLGCGLVLVGVAVRFPDSHTITEVLLLIIFISMTNPISAHLLAKANHLTDR